ncbi:MAG: DUF4352 domain-containing protein [Actinomycetia bacterium]|nr:DUF4352 domain-containing protein [Actinomycetes bacterium]
MGNLEVKVIRWEFKDDIDDYKPAEGNKFLVAEVEVANNGDKPFEPVKPGDVVMPGSPWSVRTPEGYKYGVSTVFTHDEVQPYFPDTPIDPSEKARGNIASEVPTDIGTMFLEFNSTEGRAKIKLQ